MRCFFLFTFILRWTKYYTKHTHMMWVSTGTDSECCRVGFSELPECGDKVSKLELDWKSEDPGNVVVFVTDETDEVHLSFIDLYDVMIRIQRTRWYREETKHVFTHLHTISKVTRDMQPLTSIQGHPIVWLLWDVRKQSPSQLSAL